MFRTRTHSRWKLLLVLLIVLVVIPVAFVTYLLYSGKLMELVKGRLEIRPEDRAMLITLEDLAGLPDALVKHESTNKSLRSGCWTVRYEGSVDGAESSVAVASAVIVAKTAEEAKRRFDASELPFRENAFFRRSGEARLRAILTTEKDVNLTRYEDAETGIHLGNARVTLRGKAVYVLLTRNVPGGEESIRELLEQKLARLPDYQP